VQTLNIITKMSHNPKKMKSQPVKHFIHLGWHNRYIFFHHNAGCVWCVWRLLWCYLSYVKWKMKRSKSLKNTMASCCVPWKTHFILFMASVVLPTELFVGLCCVIYLSSHCNTNITNQNMTWSMTFLETCIDWSPVSRKSLTVAW
jgi:hypothetical protein